MIPLPPSTDRELLAAYVKSADGAAFAALTERHLGLVFGIAFRRTRSREMAQEAAQNTFCRLATHAPRLRVGSSLAPWLHTVTLREAGMLVRAEAARARALDRFAAAAPSRIGFPGGPQSPPGSEHLDEALGTLPEPARRALILRYLQGSSLRDVAVEENISEEAARKRVTRALDRLSRVLARKGVTAAGVTACLASASALWPAPVSASSLAADAIRKAALPGGAGLGSLAGFVSSWWPSAAVFLLAGTLAAWPWPTASSQAGSKSLTFRDKAQDLEPDDDTASGKRDAESTAALPAMLGELKKELRNLRAVERRDRGMSLRFGNAISRKAFRDWPVDVARLAALRSAVLDFSLEEVKAAASLPDGDAEELITSDLYSRWAELEPEEALSAAAAHAERTGSQESLLGALKTRALDDPAAAVQWVRTMAPEKCGDTAPGGCRESLVRSLLAPLVSSDPSEYARLVETSRRPGDPLPEDGGAWLDVLPYDPAAAMAGLREREVSGSLKIGSPLRDLARGERIRPTEAEAVAAFALELPSDSVLRQECLSTGALVYAGTDRPRAADWMLASRPPDARTEAAWKGAMTGFLRDWKAEDPEGPARWLGANTEMDPDAQWELARAAGLRPPQRQIPTPPAR